VLTITQNAAQAMETIFASAPEVPDSAGMRISRDTASDGQPAFRLAVVEAPEQSDEVVEAENVSVFIEDGTSDLLDDKVLDARIEEGKIGFMLGDRA
jgi:iron-sulfur cluster assembly protein